MARYGSHDNPILLRKGKDGAYAQEDDHPTTDLPRGRQRNELPGGKARETPVTASERRRVDWRGVASAGKTYNATIRIFIILAIVLLPGIIVYNHVTGSISCAPPAAITPSIKAPPGQKQPVTYGREQYTSSAYNSVIDGICSANDGLRQIQSAWSWSPTDSESSLNANARAAITAFGSIFGLAMLVWFAVRGVYLLHKRNEWIGVRGHHESRQRLEEEDRIKRKSRSDSVPIPLRVFVFLPVALALAISLLLASNPSAFNVLNYAQYPSRAVTWIATFGGDHRFESFHTTVTNTESDGFSASLLGAATPAQQAADRDHVSQYLSGSYSTLKESQAYQGRFNANVHNSSMEHVATAQKTYGRALQVESAAFGGSIEFWRFILLATTIIGGLLLLFASTLWTIRLPRVTLVYGTVGALRYAKRFLLVMGCAAAFLMANAATQTVMVYLTTLYAHTNMSAGFFLPVFHIWFGWVQAGMWAAIILVPFLYVLISYATIKFCIRLIRRSLDARIYEHENMEPARQVRMTRLVDNRLSWFDNLLSHRTVAALARRRYAEIGAPPRRRALTGRR